MKFYQTSFLAMILCLVMVSCGSDNEETEEQEVEKMSLLALLDTIPEDKYFATDPFSDLDLDIYGIWKFDSSTGGFSGGGYGLDFDYLLLKPNSIFGIVKDDVLIQSGKIEIISEPNEDVVIEFFAEMISNPTNINLTRDTKGVTIVDDRLHLISGCCDRFSEFFIKEE